MRPIEIIFLAVLALALLGGVARTWKRRDVEGRWLLPLLALFAGVFHAALEGPRWQLSPAYLLCILLLLLSLRAAPARPGWAYCGAFFGLLLVAAGAALAWVLPIPKLPAPGGPYAVGTMSLHLIDAARREYYSGNPEDTREIMLQLWYPAEPGPAQRPMRLLPDAAALAPAIAEELKIPPVVLSHLGLIDSNAFENAPVAGEEEHFPVVVYSHGWTGFRQVAANEAERLASHGFVVAAPDHTFGSAAVVFPGGHTALNNPKAMPPKQPKDAYQQGIEQLVDTYAGDLRFTLDQLQAVHDGIHKTPLARRLDLARVGLFGHSTGGGAVFEMALGDPRVKCAVGLDPWVEPVSANLREIPLHVPYMSIRSEDWAARRDENSAILKELLGRAKGEVYDFYLERSGHNDFTLMPLLSPYAYLLGEAGTIGTRALEVVDDYLLAFFNRHLREIETPLLPGPSPTHTEMRPAP